LPPRLLTGGFPDLALIALFALPLLFMGLSDLPILLWDESRLANNAIEMHRDGFGLVTRYLGSPISGTPSRRSWSGS
jgi:hypothetical protein